MLFKITLVSEDKILRIKRVRLEVRNLLRQNKSAIIKKKILNKFNVYKVN